MPCCSPTRVVLAGLSASENPEREKNLRMGGAPGPQRASVPLPNVPLQATWVVLALLVLAGVTVALLFVVKARSNWNNRVGADHEAEIKTILDNIRKAADVLIVYKGDDKRPGKRELSGLRGIVTR